MFKADLSVCPLFFIVFFHPGLDLCQNLPSGINLRLAIAFFDIQIGAALRAKSAAIFATQRAAGQLQFQLFKDHSIQIDLVIFVDGEIEIAFAQFALPGLTCVRISGRIE